MATKTQNRKMMQKIKGGKYAWTLKLTSTMQMVLYWKELLSKLTWDE